MVDAIADRHDAQGRCGGCQGGKGRHRCGACQSDSLVAHLEASLRPPADSAPLATVTPIVRRAAR
jgi:hypothetical protein